MARRPKPTDYEPCPACGGRRWLGLKLPICDACNASLPHEWTRLHLHLRLTNASEAVMCAVNAALVADCRERIASAAHPRPFRRPHS